MTQKFCDNSGISIEYHSLNNEMSGVPLVIIPGAIVGAADIVESIKSDCNIKTIIISLRGRGESSKPLEGYTLDDQVSDIECVVKSEKLDEFYIMGHSNGAGIAAKYVLKNPGVVRGLILADFPPAYPSFSAEWAERVKSNVPLTSENLLNGLVRDSVKQFLLNELSELNIETLILKSGGEDSILPIELAQKINTSLPNSKLVILNNCRHEMFSDNPKEVFDEVKKFMEAV